MRSAGGKGTADLTRASLVRPNLDDAVLRGTVVDDADLVKASLYGVDALNASVRETRLMGASLIDVDFQGSDLSQTVVREKTFKVIVDEKTTFTGMSSTLFGPLQLIGREGRREIGGAGLKRWLRERGSDVRVLESRR
ncbi:hypothetical protein GCM10019016_053180 [Streptomyces prasinosporus]|uniref:Pentapeptide repeat-containing protein n=1 Tax=Streptomyces prasinosporus TaxID=68256 RepID=A0ABP6TTV4_9ACTN